MSFLSFSRKRQEGSAPNFLQDLEENTCSLQPALKSTCTRSLKLVLGSGLDKGGQ